VGTWHACEGKGQGHREEPVPALHRTRPCIQRHTHPHAKAHRPTAHTSVTQTRHTHQYTRTKRTRTHENARTKHAQKMPKRRQVPGSPHALSATCTPFDLKYTSHMSPRQVRGGAGGAERGKSCAGGEERMGGSRATNLSHISPRQVRGGAGGEARASEKTRAGS